MLREQLGTKHLIVHSVVNCDQLYVADNVRIPSGVGDRVLKLSETEAKVVRLEELKSCEISGVSATRFALCIDIGTLFQILRGVIGLHLAEDERLVGIYVPHARITAMEDLFHYIEAEYTRRCGKELASATGSFLVTVRELEERKEEESTPPPHGIEQAELAQPWSTKAWPMAGVVTFVLQFFLPNL